MKKIIKLLVFVFLFVIFTNKVQADVDPNCKNGTIYSDNFRSNITGQIITAKVVCLTGDLKRVYEDIMGPLHNSILDDVVDNNAVPIIIVVDYGVFTDEFYEAYTQYSNDYLIRLKSEIGDDRFNTVFNLINTIKGSSVTDPEPDKVCVYGTTKLTFNRQSGKIEINIPGTLEIEYDDLKAINFECPPKICVKDGFINFGASNDYCTPLEGNAFPNGNNNTGNYGSGSSTTLPPTKEISCEEIKKLTDPIWKWLMIIGPSLALVLGVFDLLRGVASGDDKAVSKAITDFTKRLGLAALLLMIPIIIKIIIGLVEFKNPIACLIFLRTL